MALAKHDIEVLAARLKRSRMRQRDAANQMDLSDSTLSKILSGKVPAGRKAEESIRRFLDSPDPNARRSNGANLVVSIAGRSGARSTAFHSHVAKAIERLSRDGIFVESNAVAIEQFSRPSRVLLAILCEEPANVFQFRSSKATAAESTPLHGLQESLTDVSIAQVQQVPTKVLVHDAVPWTDPGAIELRDATIALTASTADVVIRFSSEVDLVKCMALQVVPWILRAAAAVRQ